MRRSVLCFGLTFFAASIAQIGCRATSGGQSGDEGGLGDRTGTGNGNSSRPTQPFCWHNVSYGYGETARSQCESTDERYRTRELQWLGGDTPAGPYRCACPDGGRDVAAAGSCEDALEEACGVDLEGPRECYEQLRPYFHAGDPPYSICYPVRGVPGSWSCQCDPGGPLTSVEDQECRSALLATCTCPSDAGMDAGTCWVPKLDAGR